MNSVDDLYYRLEAMCLEGMLDGCDEICVDVTGVKDIRRLRWWMLEYYDMILFSQWWDDDKVWFVKKCVLEDLRQYLNSKGEGSMDWDLLGGIDGVLLDPLGYEWRWTKFKIAVEL